MSLKGKHIFILDDNSTDVALMQTILHQAGVKTHFERRGKDIASILRGMMPVDLIIMDLVLWADVTGYDVLEHIRSFPDLAEIPVVMVTSADAGQEMPIAQANGFNGYISKPIRVNTFTVYLNDVFEKGEVWAPQR